VARITRKKVKNKMKLTEKEILRFLEDKGIGYRATEDKIILKHCPMDYHSEKWCVAVWFETTKRDWYFMCKGSTSHYNQAFPFTELIRLCDHNIDKIRNKQIKIK
jgi:hypothetical protein